MLKIRVVKAMLRVTAAAAISLLVAVSASAQTVRYIHTDGLGSVVLITDKDRSIVERSEYEPYGSLLNHPPTDGPGYSGHVTDAATELTYMQQRYYDPSIGLFLSVDPIAVYNNPDVVSSRYWYADNNPYRYTDPDGRAANDSQERKPIPITDIPVVRVTALRDLPSQETYSSIVTLSGVSAVPIPMEYIKPLPWISSTAGALVMAPFLYFATPDACSYRCGELAGWRGSLIYMSGAFPPGFWDAEEGAAAWGRRNGVGAKEGKDKFHRGIKQGTKGARGDHGFGVNPDTGDVIDPNGEIVGNLND